MKKIESPPINLSKKVELREEVNFNEEVEEDDESSKSEEDVDNPANGASSNALELRTQLQDLMNTLIGLANQNQPGINANPPPAQPASSAPVPNQIDAVSLRQLQDMGFAENRARKSLLLNRMNTQAAMDWLLEHNDDPDIDEPISNESMSRIASEAAEFRPDASAAQRLQEMGFSNEDVTLALRTTNNNYEAAAAWLLGDRDMGGDNADVNGALGSLDDSNPLVHAILSHPTIQASLSNPRVINAFQTMIENPATSSQYVNDPEIGPILLQVQDIINQSSAEDNNAE